MSDQTEQGQQLPDLPARDGAKDDAAVRGGFNPQPDPPAVHSGGVNVLPDAFKPIMPAVQKL